MKEGRRRPAPFPPDFGDAAHDPEKGAHAMITNSRRADLLALAVTFSAGIHAALVPEHLEEMPRLGELFIAAAAIGGSLAIALVLRPGDRRISFVAGVFCLGQIAAWALFVSVSVPGFPGTPEPIEAIALVSKAIEVAAVALAFSLAPPESQRKPTHVDARLFGRFDS